jgi:hypothetical protein
MIVHAQGEGTKGGAGGQAPSGFRVERRTLNPGEPDALDGIVCALGGAPCTHSRWHHAHVRGRVMSTVRGVLCTCLKMCQRSIRGAQDGQQNMRALPVNRPLGPARAANATPAWAKGFTGIGLAGATLQATNCEGRAIGALRYEQDVSRGQSWRVEKGKKKDGE